MKMQYICFFWLFILICWKTATTSPVVYHVPHHGSSLIIKPMVKYKISNGIIMQLSPTNKNCDDSVIKYIWNGSHFLIGAVLSSYAGKYVMRLQNSSNIWENQTFEIIMHNLPSVSSQKVIVDEGDSINLTCTYKSNCDLADAMWTKDELNSLGPVEKKKIGNNTNVLTYILKNVERHFAKNPYLCFLSNNQKVTVNLEVKDPQKPGVEKTNKSSSFEENKDAVIYFSILGSPLPNLTCIHEKTKSEIISCSKKKMRSILYASESKPCKSKNGRYILSSQSSQTEKVKLWISKVKRERDNGTIFCRLLNSKGQKEDFRLAVDVKVSTKEEKDEDKKYLFIAIGCGLSLLMFFAIILVLYVKERRRSSAYRRFFLANNYTIDPLKTLNEQMHDLSYDEDWEFPYMYLEFNELIGCGAFGKVYKAKAYGMGLVHPRDKSTHARKQRRQLNKARGKMKLVHSEENSCMTVAVKTTKDNPNINDIRNLAGELKMIIHVGQHENIVNVLGACTKHPKLYMIIEYCSHGSLLDFLRTKRDIFHPTWFKADFGSKERFAIGNLVSAAIQICNGMKFLASRKCIHRDLAARNVLVTENYVMKVADFGMAREVLDTDNYISNTQGYLPIKWMALESILEKVYTEESDVWSFGILLWEMFTLGQTPYPTIPVQQLVEFLSDCVRMDKPDHCPADIHLIMLDCWNQDPKERPSFEVLHNKLQKLLQANIIEDSGIDMDINHDGVPKETDIF